MSEINKHFSNSLGIVENKNNYYTTQRNSSKIKNHFEQQLIMKTNILTMK